MTIEADRVPPIDWVAQMAKPIWGVAAAERRPRRED